MTRTGEEAQFERHERRDSQGVRDRGREEVEGGGKEAGRWGRGGR